ncbi:MAG: NCS2 family permease, partial [Anaerovoracaceae bacterium]
MERLFKLKENNTNVKTEAIAGLTTFLSMVYILAVNPAILSQAGLNPASVFTATAVSAALGTLFMAFFANYPIALASGMGLNAYFSFSVCIPLAQAGIEDPWKIALTAVLVEGFIFVLLSLCKFREALVNKIPNNLKLGITAGIGLFIAIVGLHGAGIVVTDPTAFIALGDLRSPSVALALIGLLTIAILRHYNVTGYVLWGILFTWGLGILAQFSGWYTVTEQTPSLLPSFASGMKPAAPVLFGFNFSYMFDHVLEFAVIVFSFLFVDLFDTAGALVALARKANLLDKDGNLPRVGGALMSDALGTIAGACLGTSTVTTYAESSAGIAVGGKTGLASVFTAGLFLISLLLAPIFLAIPSFATAPTLVFVGLLMVTVVKDMDFEEDMAGALGGFLAMIMMPFTYSIANGIMFAILSFVLIKIGQGRIKDIRP